MTILAGSYVGDQPTEIDVSRSPVAPAGGNSTCTAEYARPSVDLYDLRERAEFLDRVADQCYTLWSGGRCSEAAAERASNNADEAWQVYYRAVGEAEQ